MNTKKFINLINKKNDGNYIYFHYYLCKMDPMNQMVLLKGAVLHEAPVNSNRLMFGFIYNEPCTWVITPKGVSYLWDEDHSNVQDRDRLMLAVKCAESVETHETRPADEMTSEKLCELVIHS